MSKWKNDVASINKSKQGNLYIEVKEDFTVKKGDRLILKSKKQEIEESVTANRISEEKGEELKKNLHFVKYIVSIPPRDQE